MNKDFFLDRTLQESGGKAVMTKTKSKTVFDFKSFAEIGLKKFLKE